MSDQPTKMNVLPSPRAIQTRRTYRQSFRRSIAVLHPALDQIQIAYGAMPCIAVAATVRRRDERAEIQIHDPRRILRPDVGPRVTPARRRIDEEHRTGSHRIFRDQETALDPS